MKAANQLDINWEVEAVLSWHDENAKAAIATLLDDIHHLRDQLLLADQALSQGLTRGWRPSLERCDGPSKPASKPTSTSADHVQYPGGRL